MSSCLDESARFPEPDFASADHDSPLSLDVEEERIPHFRRRRILCCHDSMLA